MKAYLFGNLVVILLTVAFCAAGPNAHTGCNLDLMNAFKLEGRKTPELNKAIDICGNVRDNCCTFADQMLIVKFWKDYSSPLLAYRVNKIIDYYRTIFSFHHYFFGLQIETLPSHLFRERALRYRKTTCRTEYEFFPNFEEEDFVQITKAKKKKKGGRKLVDKSENEDFVAQVSCVSEDSPIAETPLPRSLADQAIATAQTRIEIPESEMKKMQRISTLKERFQTTIQRSLKRVTDIVARKLNKIEEMKQVLQNRLNLINNRIALGGSVSDSRLLAADHGPAQSSNTKELFDFKNFNDFYRDKEIFKSDKTMLDEQRSELETAIAKLDKNAKKILKYENKALMKKMNIDFDNDKFAKFLEDVQSIKLPYMPGVEGVIRRRSSPPSLPIDVPKLVCTRTRNTIYRRIYYLNQMKYRYCDNVLWATKKIHLADFVNFLPDVQQSIIRMGSLRRSLYCAICDLSTQKYIDFSQKVVFYNEEFCESYIWEFAEYFRWKDILFVEYLNNVFQTISCFDSNGRVAGFPFKTMIDHQFQKSFFYRRCFDAINTADWFKYCHFICREFKYDTLNQLIEGDIAFLKEVVSRILSFLRKQNVNITRLDLAKLDKVTKVNFFETHHNQKVQADINDMILGDFEKELKAAEQARLRRSQSTSKSTVTRRIGSRTSSASEESEFEPEQPSAETSNEGRLLEETVQSPANSERRLTVTTTDDSLTSKHRKSIFERRLSGNDFISEAVYSPRVDIGQINKLAIYFFKDNRGINPIAIDNLVNFDFDTDDYLKTYAVKNSAELISSEVLHCVLVSIPNEKSFNEGIHKQFKLQDGDYYSPVEEYQKFEENMREGQNPLSNHVFREKHRRVDVPLATATEIENQYKSDGVPELEYILS